MDLRFSVPVNPATSYWCFQCTRVVSVSLDDGVICRHCGGGFVQAVDSPSEPQPVIGSPPVGTIRRRRRNALPPLIVLPSQTLHRSDGGEASGDRSYELYYDFGDGLGLRPLPSTTSEMLLGPGFGPVLDRIAQMGFNMWARPENPPASKTAIASLPKIEISSCHVESELQCAVCKDEFALGSEAREMPCKHLYHPDCIHPWLSHHNTCPVCRHELPGEDLCDIPGRPGEIALAIWRLPGGGIAVGRFMGGREAVPPPEVQDGWNFINDVPREIRWGPLMRRRRFRGTRRFFGNLGSNIIRRVTSCVPGGAPVRRVRSFSESDSVSVYSIRQQ